MSQQLYFVLDLILIQMTAFVQLKRLDTQEAKVVVSILFKQLCCVNTLYTIRVLNIQHGGVQLELRLVVRCKFLSQQIGNFDNLLLAHCDICN